jgi:anti-anti-sigma factor
MNLADLDFAEHDDLVVAHIRGDIDHSNAFSVQDAITHRIPNTKLGLVLDLSGASYLDSAGIRMIYQMRELLAARGQSLLLVLPPDAPAHHALWLAGISEHIGTVATLADAWI